MYANLSAISSLVILAVTTAIPLFDRTGPAQDTNSRSRQPVESRLRVLEDREEIRQLLVDYGRTLDQRDFAAFSKLFAENAEYIGGGGTNAIKGPAAIAKSLEDIFQKNPTGVRSPNLHLFANEIIQVNGDEAVVVSKGLFVVPNQANMPEMEMMATYHDILTRDHGHWKFRRRVVKADIPAPSR